MKYTPDYILDHLEVVSINHKADFEDNKKMVEACKKYGFKICYGIKSFYPWIINELKDYKTMVGGSMVLFGPGTDATNVKLFAAKHVMDLGVDEIDMNMNTALLRSHMDDEVLKEQNIIRKFVDRPLKVIIEVPTLKDDELERACKIVAESGADYVKTATGFFGNPTMEMVERMLKAVEGSNTKVKCSGGVAGLAMVEELLDMGVARIGLGYAKALAICEEMGI